MKIIDVIKHLEKVGTWVNWDKTRDIVLHGSTDKEITKIGVCWVATNQVIEQAKKEGINFIISHENIFYQASTNPDRLLLESANEKRKLLDEGDISVYRCHDVWDLMPDYGVVDVWAKDIDLIFEPRNVNSYYSYANVNGLTVKEISQKVANAVYKYGQEGIQVIGNMDKEVHRVAIGTGAETDIFLMLKGKADVLVVSDDGVSNWIAIQYCLDHDIPVIIVNHASCEIGGLQEMVHYFNEVYPLLEVQYLYEGYKLQSVLGNGNDI